METTLFKIRGFGFTLRHLSRIIIVIAVAGTLFGISRTIRNHYNYVDSLEKLTQSQEGDIRELNGHLAQAEQTNRDNLQAIMLYRDIQGIKESIALQSRAVDAARVATYKEIRDAIQASEEPSNDCPVAPVILSTLNSLWSIPTPTDSSHN